LFEGLRELAKKEAEEKADLKKEIKLSDMGMINGSNKDAYIIEESIMDTQIIQPQMPQVYNVPQSIYPSADIVPLNINVGHAIYNKVDKLENKVDKCFIKAKAKCIQHEIGILEDNLVVWYIYDDGNSTHKILIPNFAQNFEVYNVKFDGISELDGKYYQIRINDKFVLGEIDRISGKDIYNNLLSADVTMYKILSVNKLSELINGFFRAALFQNYNERIIAGRAGWLGNTYCHSQNAIHFANLIRYDFPIYNKVLSSGKLNRELMKMYFDILKCIDNSEQRGIICLLPIVGILASIFNEEGITLPKALNLVFVDTSYKREILNILKIFNRNKNELYSLDVSDKNLEKEIRATKDQVLIVDGCIGSCATRYKTEKVKNKALKLAKIVTKNIEINGGKDSINMVATIASETYITDDCIFNIIVDEFFLNKAMPNIIGNNAVDAIGILYSDFIEYAMRYIDIIKDVITKRRNCGIKSKALVIAFEIFKTYLDIKGYSLEDELNFCIEDINNIFDEEFESNKYELMDAFKKGTRMAMSNFCCQHKEEAEDIRDECVYYNEDFMWISKYSLDYILAITGLNQMKNQILNILKEEGHLVIDGKGYTKKIQISKERRLFYQLKLQFFESGNEGNIPILALAQEVKNV